MSSEVSFLSPAGTARCRSLFFLPSNDAIPLFGQNLRNDLKRLREKEPNSLTHRLSDINSNPALVRKLGGTITATEEHLVWRHVGEVATADLTVHLHRLRRRWKGNEAENVFKSLKPLLGAAKSLNPISAFKRRFVKSRRIACEQQGFETRTTNILHIRKAAARRGTSICHCSIVIRFPGARRSGLLKNPVQAPAFFRL